MEASEQEKASIYSAVRESFREAFELSAEDMQAIDINSSCFFTDPIEKANILISVKSLLLNLYRDSESPSTLASAWLKTKEIGREKETPLDILKSCSAERIERLKALLSFSIPRQEWEQQPWI